MGNDSGSNDICLSGIWARVLGKADKVGVE